MSKTVPQDQCTDNILKFSYLQRGLTAINAFTHNLTERSACGPMHLVINAVLLAFTSYSINLISSISQYR